MRYVRLLLISLVLLAAFLIAQVRGGQPALAAHHIAQISEVMSGFAKDPDVQFVEIQLLAPGQGVIANTRLTVFNADGSFNTVLLILGSGAGTSPGRVLMATQAFVDLTPSPGVTPDFIFPPGILPDAGMVCWGAPGVIPPGDPNSWDETNPNLYVDCVSYGGTAFTGSNPMMSNPESASPGAGNGQRSLTRVMDSVGKGSSPWRNSDNGMFYDLLAASPENNAGVTGTLVPPVGGIAELPDAAGAPVAGAPLATGESSGLSAGLLAAIAAGATAGAIALGGAAWYTRRRLGAGS